MTRFAKSAVFFAAACLLGDAAPGSAAPAGAPSLAPLALSHDWIGREPSAAALAGHVVVVDVFTVDCYNCRNVTPNLKKLAAEPGVVVIGVHSPETPYEHERANVVENAEKLGITWPVAIDNDFAIWNRYGVTAWPTQLVFDRTGRLRDTFVGDSQDETLDGAVDRLLAEPYNRPS